MPVLYRGSTVPKGQVAGLRVGGGRMRSAKQQIIIYTFK